MLPIEKLRRRIKSIDINDIFNEIISDKQVKELAADLNNDRLDEGLSPENKLIVTYFANSPNVYADKTIKIRQALRMQYRRVDLKFTGRFRKSIKAYKKNGTLNVTGNLKKRKGMITDNVNFSDIFGFLNSDISEINEFVIKSGKVKNAILKRLNK